MNMTVETLIFAARCRDPLWGKYLRLAWSLSYVHCMIAFRSCSLHDRFPHKRVMGHSSHAMLLPKLLSCIEIWMKCLHLALCLQYASICVSLCLEQTSHLIARICVQCMQLLISSISDWRTVGFLISYQIPAHMITFTSCREVDVSEWEKEVPDCKRRRIEELAPTEPVVRKSKRLHKAEGTHSSCALICSHDTHSSSNAFELPSITISDSTLRNQS